MRKTRPLPFGRGSVLIAAAAVAAFAQEPAFERDVAPILAANCVVCHSAAVKLGELRLDSFAALMKGGLNGPAVVAGKSSESRLVRRLTGEDKPTMPFGGAPLPAEKIAAIRRWIDAGAKGPANDAAIAAAPAIPEIKPTVPVKPQVFALAWRPDGSLLAAGGFREVRLSDASGRAVATLTGHTDKVCALDFSRDGRLLAAGGGLAARKGEVRIWDVESRTLVRTILGHDDAIYAVAFSPDGKLLATASYDKLIKLWDVASGAGVRTLKDHIDAVYALAFTPDGKRLLSGSADRTVKVWNPATGERLFTLSEPLDGINAIALDPSGRLVAAGGMDKTIRIWSLEESGGKLVQSLMAHEDAILRLAWSPDGKLLVSSAADKTIKIFRAEGLTEVRALGAQPDWVTALAFAPDGTHFAAARFDGSLEVYSQ